MNGLDSNVITSRRDFLKRTGTGFGMLALSGMSGAAPVPHFAPKAKRVVHLFMNGGPSQVDTFDPKPILTQWHGKPLPVKNFRTERRTGHAMGSPYSFKRYGQSGLPVSEVFAKTAVAAADDLCVIRSMQAEVPNHEPSLMLMNCGDGQLPRPSFGSWVNYGLGTENANLPGFVVMCPGGYPIVATRNWRSAFLPGAYQGTHLDTKHTDVTKLIANIRNSRLKAAEQRRLLDLTQALNAKHLKERAADPALEARIQSFELAFRMQTEAAKVFEIKNEPKHMLDSYGSGTHGRQLLMTRRLLERGVRFVQVWSGNGQPWDNHNGLAGTHRKLAGEWDQPLAAFLTDLRQRGLLESTLVLWGGEFGRTPVAEYPALNGRDHNHYGFTCWLAGGGTRGGYVHGATDEFGFRAVKDVVHVHDLHATMLHLLGLDHERLTYRHAGRDFRLTDVHGNVVKDILA